MRHLAIQAVTAAVLLITPSPGTQAPENVQNAAEPAGPVMVTLDELIAKTLDLLEAFDARVGQKPSPAELEELNRYIVAIQKQAPDDPRVSYLYGRAWALMGRTGQAITELERFTAAREGRLEWRAFRTLGDLYVDQFPHLAKSNYEKADKLKPKEPSVLFGLSRSYFSLGDFQKALSLAQQAVSEDNGRHVPYLAHLARVLRANQQWAEADRIMVGAIELATKDVEAAPGRSGPLVVLQSQLQEMITLLQERAQMPSATAQEYARLAKYTVDHAEVAAVLSKHDALAVLETALRRFDTQPTAPLLEQYATLLAAVNRTEDATAAFRKLQEIDPENALAKEWLTRHQGSLSTSGGDTATE